MLKPNLIWRCLFIDQFKIGQSRNFHLIQNKSRNGRQILSIKNQNNLKSNRQISYHNLELISYSALFLISFWLLLRKFGPNQAWYIEKCIDLKFKIFNKLSDEKLEIDEVYIKKIQNTTKELKKVEN